MRRRETRATSAIDTTDRRGSDELPVSQLGSQRFTTYLWDVHYARGPATDEFQFDISRHQMQIDATTQQLLDTWMAAFNSGHPESDQHFHRFVQAATAQIPDQRPSEQQLHEYIRRRGVSNPMAAGYVRQYAGMLEFALAPAAGD